MTASGIVFVRHEEGEIRSSVTGRPLRHPAHPCNTLTKIANGTVVTVFVSNMTFLEPVRVGDAICCYTDTVAIGETSITLAVEVWVLRQGQGDRIKVTDAEFKFVALNDNGCPRPVLA